ncbi:hypothetical protein VW41_06590 [Klebsiella michiganensis]|nr:hypothetical protein VW41_06590 [Klebsiella michiganensis]
MDHLSALTVSDLVSFTIVILIGFFIFIRRRRNNRVKSKGIFMFALLAAISFSEVFNSIYTTYSYQHNRLYNNDKFTTAFNYDLSNIIFYTIIMLVAVVLFIQEYRIRKRAC